jgi:hypothetical protein
MTETVRLKIPPPLAVYLRPGVTAGERRRGVADASVMEPVHRVLLLFCLMRDPDPDIREAAGTAFSALPVDVLATVAAAESSHPVLLDAIARVHHNRDSIAEILLAHGNLSASARAFLQESILRRTAGDQGEPASSPDASGASASSSGEEGGAPGAVEPDGVTPHEGVDDTPDVSGAQQSGKYKLAQTLGIAEKIRMALTGDKEWRSILVKDANRLVSSSVIKNPRITEAEVVALLKAGIQNDEIVRLICANKEWIKSYAVRKALVDNHRTPLPTALRFLATLSDRDIAGYARSRNVSTVIATQAKRLIAAKQTR